MIEKKQIERVLELINKDVHNYEHFFRNVNDIEWVKALLKNDYFQNPPEPVSDERGIRFPNWPETKALIRLVKKDPAFITQIVLDLPETDNIRVHEDYIEIAVKALPHENAIKVLELEIEWMAQQDFLYFGYSNTAADSLIELIKSEQKSICLSIMNILTELEVEEKDIEAFGAKTKMVDVKPKRLDDWHFEELFRKQFTDLYQELNVDLLKIYCDRLTEAIKADISPEDTSGNDYSYYWRPAVHDHKENSSYRIESFLFGEIRKLSDNLISDFSKEVIELLRRYDYPIFQRLELYLRDTKFELLRDGTSEFLKSYDVLSNRNYRFEVIQLLKNHFGELDKDVKESYFSIIEEGLGKEDDWIKERKKHYDKDYTHEDFLRAEKTYKYKKLLPISDYLEGDLKKTFQELSNELADVEYSETLISTSSGSVAPQIAITDEEIEKLSVEELLILFESRKPENESYRYWSGDISFNFSKLLKKRYEDVILNIELFKDYPNYAIYVINHVRDKVENSEKDVLNENILEFFDWVVNGTQDNKDGENRVWRTSFQSIAWGLHKAIRSKVHDKFLSSNSDTVFSILETLVNDYDPNEAKIKEAFERNDLISCSINSVRGVSIEAYIDYLSLLKDEEEKEEKTLRDKLDYLLESIKEREIIARYIDHTALGGYLGVIAYVSMDWLKKNIEDVLARDEDVLHSISFSAYISNWNSPSEELVEIIIPDYEFLLENYQLYHGIRSGHAIANHVARIIVNDDQTEGMMKCLVESDELESVQSSLLRLFGEYLESNLVDENSIGVITSFWEDRSNYLLGKHNLSRQDKRELGNFSFIYLTNKCDTEWAFDQWIKILPQRLHLFNTDEVLEKLIEDFEVEPTKCLTAIRLLIENIEYIGYLRSSLPKLKTLFEKIKGHEEPIIKQSNRIVDELIRKGQEVFREYYISN